MPASAHTDPLTDAFDRAVADYAMIAPEDDILCAFSGGADSSALLLLLCRRCPGRVRALHVHHGIRGAEADRDEAFCRTFCSEHGIPFTAVHADVPALAREGKEGLEAAARRVRYRALEEAADRYGCQKIAVAHTADDNAETVLFHLIRGSGLSGLCGIPPVRGRIIRPLLGARRADTERFCRENGIAYVTDSTNADTTLTRNYIRHELMPRIARLNPAFPETLTRSCRSLGEDGAYLDALARAVLPSSDTASLADLARPVLARVIASRYRAFAGKDALSPDSRHIRAAAAAIRSRPAVPVTLSFPGRVRAVIGGPGAGLFFEKDDRIPRRRREKRGSDEAFSPLFLHEGTNPLPAGGTLILRRENDPFSPAEKDKNCDKNIYKLSIHTAVDSDKIVGNLSVRYRRAGDTVRAGHHTKSIKKLLNERHIPVSDRDTLPFLCDGDGILWIPGVCLRDGVKPSDGARRITLFYLKHDEE